MLQVQDAVKISLEALGTVFSAEDVRDPRLEEVTLSDDEQYWLVTLSFTNPDSETGRINSSETDNLSSLLLKLNGSKRRVTKTIKLRATDGQFVGIKSQWEY